MKVKDLIQKLQEIPQDTYVLTPGFDETGLEMIESIKIHKVLLQKRFITEPFKSHSGPHDYIEYMPKEVLEKCLKSKDYIIEDCVVINF
jgi:hypothetical protein